MRLKFRQYLCKHDYKYLAKHKHTMQELWKCRKCGVYYIQHLGILVGGMFGATLRISGKPTLTITPEA